MTNNADILEKIIRTRVTEKVMCDPVEDQAILPEGMEVLNQKRVLASLKTAGWAPFHYCRGIDGIAEPWRAHILWKQVARDASKYMQDTLQIKTKEPRLSAACSALVLINWIPELTGPVGGGGSAEVIEKISIRNEEHLAASAAMVQNFLLMLTAHGMGNYWSSGGRFRSKEMFDYLKIPTTECLLAAVFIEYPEEGSFNSVPKERKPGAQRDSRSQEWIGVVS